MTKLFSEVSLAYNEHLANLDEARRQFEDDVRGLNNHVADRLAEIASKPAGGLNKTRWSRLSDSSRQREGSWLTWVAGSSLELDVRAPRKKNFRRGAGLLYFETAFDHTVDRYRFRARFENQNLADDGIDEAVIDYVTTRTDEFPNSDQIKSNTAILLRVELEEGLNDAVGGYVESTLRAICAGVDAVFPDELYRVGGEIDPDEADVDDDAATSFDDEDRDADDDVADLG